jgi:outer membrane receptor protein involved in Fe transport
LFTLSAAATWAADDAQKLQDENATLRKRLAELEGRTGAAPTSLATASADESITVLSPYSVTSDKDYGYLKTNAATATRIGMEIQKVPLNISVVSREFIDDTNARSLTDLLRYSSAAAGDNRFAMRVPRNEATPQGYYTVRGFNIDNTMVNGLYRYTANNNLDNIERVDIIKGPASVFFGQGYPGGVINYITKRASLSKIPSTFAWSNDDNGGDKLVIDVNSVLSKKAAFRIVGGWTDTAGDRAYEFKKGFNVTPSVVLVPFDSGKIKINLDFEYLHERFDSNDADWVYSDFAGWKSAATTGQYGVSTAVLANTIIASAGNGLTANVVQSTTTPVLPYTTYMAAKRVALNDFTLPGITSLQRGAFYTNKAGNVIQDKSFNWTSRGTYSDNEIKDMTASMEFTPFEWLSGRFAWVRDVATFTNLGNSTNITPYADGVHFNVGQGAGSLYNRETKTALLDLVLKYDIWGIKSKLLLGAQKGDWRQNYGGKVGQTDLQLAYLPGATNTVSNPDYFGTNRDKYNFSSTNGLGTGARMVPFNEVIRDRAGNIKPVRQIYTNWDPGAEINPSIAVINKTDLDYLDGYRPTLSSMYVNYQGSLFDDRLTILAGVREEKRYERWQDQSVIYPWYIMNSDMILHPDLYPEDQWNQSKAYQQTIPLDQKGKSWMAGLSFAVTKSINLYASHSVTFKFNSGNVGGFFPGPGIGDELGAFQAALDWGQRKGNPGDANYFAGHPGSFVYNGTNITSVAQAKSVMAALGAYDMIKNETGKNDEFGVKISTEDGKIVGTLSIFRGERSNQKLDDGPRQTAEQWNGANNMVTANSYFDPADSLHYAKTIFRWRSTDLTNRVEGVETEVIWTPIRNFQSVINGSWLPTAKTLSAINVPRPGDPRYTAASVATKYAWDMYYAARLENVPAYRFNYFGKYTFTDGPARGLAVGLGMRYSSKAVVNRSVDWNPLNGGYQSGNYVVLDVTAAYPWEYLGYKITSRFGLYNATDKDYAEGGSSVGGTSQAGGLSPPRNWVFTNTLTF